MAFVTYTFGDPCAVGVFFRALRLGFELHRRGWRFVVLNLGPIPDDPKVDRAREIGGELLGLAGLDEEGNRRETAERLRGIAPDLVVFGEEPMPGMVPYFEGARTVGAPLVLLDQHYNLDLRSPHWGVDLLLLYGLRSLWEGEVDLPGRHAVIPPFIDEVTPASALGAPPGFEGLPRVTVLGYDERVLRGGVALLGRLERHRPAVIAVNREPRLAERLMDEAGIGPERRLALPLLRDPDLFGWMATSRVTILANGFMQMMEALALGCPALAIDRGLGMWGGSLDDNFVPYLSNCETPGQQLARLDGWLEGCPFTAAQLEALRRERSGASACADHLERVAARPLLSRRLQRTGSWLRWKLRRPPRAGVRPEPEVEHGNQ